MPPPKTTPGSSERPQTDSTVANRMLQSHLGLKKKKRIIRRGKTPDKKSGEDPQ